MTNRKEFKVHFHEMKKDAFKSSLLATGESAEIPKLLDTVGLFMRIHKYADVDRRIVVDFNEYIDISRRRFEDKGSRGTPYLGFRQIVGTIRLRFTIASSMNGAFYCLTSQLVT